MIYRQAHRRKRFQHPDCRLVVVDPVSAYLGKADSHNNAEVRSVLAPLAEMAERCRVAVVCVNHLNKGGGATKALYRSMGSLAFVAAARSAYAVIEDKENPRRRLVLPIKNNLAKDTQGLAYTLESDSPDAMPYVAWETQPITARADDLLNDDADHDDRRAVIKWLKEQLASGSRKVKDLEVDGHEAGFSRKQIRTAATKLGVEKEKSGFSGGWSWSLPQPPEEPHWHEDAPTCLTPTGGHLGPLGHLRGVGVGGGEEHEGAQHAQDALVFVSGIIGPDGASWDGQDPDTLQFLQGGAG